MKKALPNFVVLLLAVASGFFVAYGLLFVISAAREGNGVGLEMAVFVTGVCTMLTLFVASIFLSRKNKIGIMTTVTFLPVAFMMMILTLWFVVFAPYLRSFRLTLDDNPLLYGGEHIEREAIVFFFEKPYWMRAANAKAYLTRLYNQKEKNSRLIKFSDPKSLQEIIGIDERTVIAAFGEPMRKTVQDAYDVWIYHPWEDHPDWQMKVFLRDSHLVSIGEPS